MCTEKHVLVEKKCLYVLAKHGFATVSLSRKDFIEGKQTEFPIKKNLWKQRSVKKVKLTVFSSMK